MSLLSHALPETLTSKEASQTLASLTRAIAQHADARVLIDAAPLKNFDSAALAVLLECRRLAQASGKSCWVSNPPTKLTALAALYGLDGLLPVTTEGA